MPRSPTTAGSRTSRAGRSRRLFPLVELFSGINSRGRRPRPVDRGAIGLPTTHDPGPAAIVAGPGPKTRDVHFEHGETRIDHRMRPGVVIHSNALSLMRAVGLEV